MANTSTEAQQAEQTASTAVEQSKELGHSARAAGSDVVAEARDQVGAVATEVRGQARQLVDDTRSRLRHQADSQRSQLADTLGSLGSELSALARGAPDDAGTAGRYVAQVGDAVGDLAVQIRDRDVAGIVDEVQRFARRRPGVFLAALAAAGFAAGRLARSTTDDRSGASGAETRTGADTPPPTPAPLEVPDMPVTPELGGTGTAVP